MTSYIYGLVNPLTHQVSYIGRTIDLYGRFDEHLKDLTENLKAKWIKTLRVSGVAPVLIVLEEVDDEIAAIRETWWINFGVRAGWPLTNSVVPHDPSDLLAEVVEELLERVANLEQEYRVRPPARQRRANRIRPLDGWKTGGWNKTQVEEVKIIADFQTGASINSVCSTYGIGWNRAKQLQALAQSVQPAPLSTPGGKT